MPEEPKKDVLTPRSKMIKSTLGLTSSFEKLSLTVRNNVLRLGMAACLNKDQFYFLAFCKGFIFPNCDLDWKILAFLETVNDIDDEEKVKNLYYEKYMDLFVDLEDKRENSRQQGVKTRVGKTVENKGYEDKS